jgi:hypothetical protein
MTQNIYLKDTKSDLFNHEYNLHACSEPQLSLTVCGMSSGGLRRTFVSTVAKLVRIDEAKFIHIYRHY